MDLTFSEFDTVVRALDEYAFMLERRMRKGRGNIHMSEYVLAIRNVREKIIREKIAEWQEQVRKEHSDGGDS